VVFCNKIIFYGEELLAPDYDCEFTETNTNARIYIKMKIYGSDLIIMQSLKSHAATLSEISYTKVYDSQENT
jgi:hypothetical protein